MTIRFVKLAVFFLLSTCAVSAAAPQSQFLTDLINTSEAKIKNAPQTAEGYSDLAFALARRARETEDPAFGKRAEEAVLKALQLAPGNFEARKARVMLRLQQGRYADAEEEAKALNKQTPDDNIMYGLLTDAALGQGKYPEAEALTQRMLDMRQVNGPGLQRAARVREAIGFPDGAVEFWNSAFRLASTSDVEERAYILTELAGISRRRAQLANASRYAADAVALEPDYPAALVEQARIAIDQKKFELAEGFLTARLKQSPSFAAQYWLASALEAAGKSARATEAGNQFVSLAQASNEAPRDRSELLVRYWTAHGKAADAVRFAESQSPRGAGESYWDAVALALLAAGDAKAANVKIEQALQPGVQNPAFFLDAAHIARKNNQTAAARGYLKKCIEVNASSEYAEIALRELQSTGENPPR